MTPTMKTSVKLTIVAALAVTVAAAMVLKKAKPAPDSSAAAPTTIANTTPSVTTNSARVANVKLPRLLDLGAGKCIPCKMMAPILEELKTEYTGRMNVEFIDVWVNPDAAKPYGIEVIPTQIFYDADGKELFRHVGFFAKAEILGKWQELGVKFEARK